MSTGNLTSSLLTFALKLGNSVVVSLLVTTGLLMVPVSCTCGASVPHSHSLFELPHHHHGSSDHRDDHMDDSVLVSSAEAKHEHDRDCDEVLDELAHADHGERHALANALEQHDGWVIKSAPSSSIGHPIAMTQPALIMLPGQQCESLILPPYRLLEGTDTIPETPPPRTLL
jgi:hypothetical protein